VQAVVYRSYGEPEVLSIEELSVPEPKDNEVLIEVRAASVNPLDWHFMRGEPGIVRLFLGLGKPKEIRFGADLAGVVRAVGSRVTRFKAGDEVFGSGRGAFAEMACVPESALAAKPASLSFEQAAALPIAGVTALQALQDKAQVRQGHQVLVNGASGGVGSFAVQIARALGAEVTAVCSARNVETVRALGAERAIDYAREDFAMSVRRYDTIVECVGNRTLRDCVRVLKPKGVIVGIGATGNGTAKMLAQMLGRGFYSLFISQSVKGMIAKMNAGDLETLARMCEQAQVRPVIDHSYPLKETAEAVRYLETMRARGKVVIAVS